MADKNLVIDVISKGNMLVLMILQQVCLVFKKYVKKLPNTRFFYKQRFFSSQPQRCLTLSWIEL